MVIIAFATTVISCKKDTVQSVAVEAENETTFELSAGQAISDNLSEDANNVFMQAASNKNLLGSNVMSQNSITANLLACATVTVTPVNGFPKTIIIDFGAGNCSTPNGITRKGKINVVLSDSVRKTGSKAVMTFINYYVNSYKKEGTITWSNTSIPSTRSWQRKVENGKVVAPDGKYWLQNGIRDVVQIGGANTPNTLLDDIFLITGNQTVTNAAGQTRECFITEALQKKNTCDNISTGKLKVEGASHYAVIDFGNGECDKLASITIDGQVTRTIILR